MKRYTPFLPSSHPSLCQDSRVYPLHHDPPEKLPALYKAVLASSTLPWQSLVLLNFYCRVEIAHLGAPGWLSQ